MSKLPICMVRAIIRDSVGGEPIAGARVSARLSSYEVYKGHVVPRDVQALSDVAGEVILPLFPNQLGSAESVYAIKIEANGRSLRTSAVVPDLPEIDLHLIAELPPFEGKNDGELLITEAIEAGHAALLHRLGAEAAAKAAEDSAADAAKARDRADDAQDAAELSAKAAAASATAADGSAEAARGSATVAEASARAASKSEIAAVASAEGAGKSDESAKAAAAKAGGHAEAATASELSAALSRDAAAGSATAAGKSATAAAGEAGKAEGHATAASASATSAKGSATEAASSKDAARGSASEASGSALAASNSEKAAFLSAGAAQASADRAGRFAGEAEAHLAGAEASANAARASRDAAETSATAAETQANAATASAGKADTARGTAETAAGRAGVSASDAEASAGRAAASAASTGLRKARVDAQHRLLIERGDGTIFDAGYVRGEQGETGAPGAGISVLGTVAKVADLPSKGNKLNDAYVVAVDGHLYVWSGAAWTDVGQFKGDPGTTDYNELKNKPVLGSAAALNVPDGSGTATAAQVVKGNDPRLANSRAPTTHTHNASDVQDIGAVGRQVLLAGTPADARKAIEAFSGDYEDLTGRPSLGTAAAFDVQSGGLAALSFHVVKGNDPRLTNSRAPNAHRHSVTDLSDASTVGTAVLTAKDAEAVRAAIGAGTSNFSGAYDDLSGKPTLGSAAALSVAAAAKNASTTQAVRGDDTRLADTRTPKAHTHSAAQVSDASATGRAVMTAETQSAAREAIGMPANFTEIGAQLVSAADAAAAARALGIEQEGRPSSVSATWEQGRIAHIESTVDGKKVVRTLAYNTDGTVRTISYPVGGKTRTETYSYAGGRFAGMSAVEK